MNKQIKTILIKIEKSKKVISKERDKLRSVYIELEDILETLDEGTDDINVGLKYIESGIDEVSKYL